MTRTTEQLEAIQDSFNDEANQWINNLGSPSQDDLESHASQFCQDHEENITWIWQFNKGVVIKWENKP